MLLGFELVFCCCVVLGWCVYWLLFMLGWCYLSSFDFCFSYYRGWVFWVCGVLGLGIWWCLDWCMFGCLGLVVGLTVVGLWVNCVCL